MLDFLLLSLPRSGSTWAANWLTSEGALCLHDPLSYRSHADLLAYAKTRRVGAACTGLWLWPDWCGKHARRLVIMERDVQGSQESLARLGLPILPEWALEKFAAMPGLRVPYTDLFEADRARELWTLLRPAESFDVDRHAMLCEMQVQPDFSKWKPDAVLLDNIARNYRI